MIAVKETIAFKER